MKKQFSSYYRKSREEIDEIWRDSIFTLDANVLLNLYRYSPETRKAMIKLLYKCSDRIWLSHQSCLEYHANRYEVISDVEKNYSLFLTTMDKIEKEIANVSKPPFFSEGLKLTFDEILEEMRKEINSNIDLFSTYFHSDEINQEIDKIVKDNVGKQFSEDELQNIITEGKERYSKKIPPGYEDSQKSKELNKYGDLILWKQIINKAQSENKNIIFVTDERKADWIWKLKNGKAMGLRQELVKEIKDEAGVDILYYSTDRFLKFGASFFEEEVNELVYAELKEFKESQKQDLEIINANQNNLDNIEALIKENKKREIKIKIEEIQQKRNEVNQSIDTLNDKEELTPDERKLRRDLHIKKDALLNQSIELNDELGDLTESFFEKIKSLFYNK